MAGKTTDIAGYGLGDLIGRGGFGTVYRANDPDHGRDVAIKILPGTFGDKERRRFDRERQTMGRLGAHPNIIAVHDSGYTDEGEGYIVMELATGGSLRDRLESDGPLPWDEAVSIMAAIAGAAQAAHDQGVLHRDIKPDNILIDQYGNPKLTDFGIASVASNATATSSTTATVAHAAPEILQGQTSTEAVDIYAVGSTLYNLITGLPPFQRHEDLGMTPMITRALTEPPPDLRPYGVPDAVALVAERALAKDMGNRQSSADQLAAELTAAVGGASIPVVKPTAEGVAANTVLSPPPDHLRGPRSDYQPPVVATPNPTLDQPVVGLRPQQPPAPPQQFNQQYLATGGPGQPLGSSQPQPAGRTSGRVWWVLVAVVILGFVGVGALIVANQDNGGTGATPTTPITDTSITTTSTTSVPETTPSTPPPTEPPATLATPQAFTGVLFDTPISWTTETGLAFQGYVITEGERGQMAVSFTDDVGPVEILQDLILVQFPDGSWGYEGFNPVWADDLTPATFYSPDILYMHLAANGFWDLNRICNQSYGCSFIDR